MQANLRPNIMCNFLEEREIETKKQKGEWPERESVFPNYRRYQNISDKRKLRFKSLFANFNHMSVFEIVTSLVSSNNLKALNQYNDLLSNGKIRW